MKLFKFLCTDRTKSNFNLCVISIKSNTEDNARLTLSADYRYLATVAIIPARLLQGVNYA